MLNIMREHVQGYLIKVILFVVIGAFIGTIFLVWGMGGADKDATVVVARVYDRPVYAKEFNRSLQNLLNFYRQVYKDKANDELIKEFDLKQRALDELVQRRILLNEAENLGLNVVREELVLRIKSIRTFQEKGVFNPLLYKQILKANRLNPSEYESSLREGIMMEKVEAMIKDRVKVSEKEIRDLYIFNNEKINADYIVLSPKTFQENVSVEDEELKTWFEKNKGEYQVEEKRGFSYLLLDPSSFHDKIRISDSEIKEYYQFNEQKYYVEPQVKASHILIKVAPNAKPEEEETAKKKIEDIRTQILAGEDFAKLAKQHSEDEANKEKGGDLGFFKKGAMVPAFEEVAFNLDIDKTSEPRKTRFGFHLIKVTDKKEGGIPAFSELKDKIKNELINEKEKEMAEDIVDTVYAELLENPDLEAVATKYSFDIKTSPPKTKKQISNRKEADAVFDLEIGQIAGIFRVGDKLKIDKFTEIVPSRIPELSEVQDKAKKDLAEEKAAQIAEEKAQAALKKLRDKKLSFEELAKTYNIEIKEAKDINRRGFISGLGRPDEPVYSLFDLKVDEYSEPFHIKDEVALFRIKEIQKIDEEKYSKERSQTIGSIMASKKEEMFNAWLTDRKKLAQIQIDPTSF